MAASALAERPRRGCLAFGQRPAVLEQSSRVTDGACANVVLRAAELRAAGPGLRRARRGDESATASGLNTRSGSMRDLRADRIDA